MEYGDICTIKSSAWVGVLKLFFLTQGHVTQYLKTIHGDKFQTKTMKDMKQKLHRLGKHFLCQSLRHVSALDFGDIALNSH